MSSAAVADHVAGISEFRRGWTVVVACFCVATFAWGFGFYGQSVYLAELQRLHGWPASLISGATTMYYLVGAALLTLVHRVIERIGSRLLLVSGVIVLGIGVIGLSQATEPWQLYLCSVVMASGWAGSTSAAIATTLAHWFDQRRGLAISLALNGASAGGFIIAPLLVWLSHRLGLAEAVTVLVFASSAIVVPTIVIGVTRPPHAAASIGVRAASAEPTTRPAFASTAAALRDLHFWSVSLPFALALMAQVGFLIHQVAFLLPHLGAEGVGAAVAATSFAAMAGRVGLGFVVDRLNQRIASAVSFASQAAGLALMLALPEHNIALYVGSVVFGLSVGNVITLPALIVQREFAARSFGLVIGLNSTVGQATLAFGPTLLGLAHDVTGGYAAALVLCIGLQLAATVMILVGGGGVRSAAPV